MSDDTRTVPVRRFFEEVCNGRRLEAAEELFTASHPYHDPSSPGLDAGAAGMKQLIGAYQRAFEDASWTVDATHIAGDVVITQWTGRGTHTGELMGIAPTGRRVEVAGIWMHRVVDGRITESWNIWDMLGMMQQLGVIPSLNATAA